MEKTNTNGSADVYLPEKVQRARNYMLDLGRLTARYARVERAPRMPDGRRETDVEHSFHLGITAPELARIFYPELDTGLIAEFANVHDLPEIITGDVWTYGISDEDRLKKEQAEAEAAELLYAVLPPHTAQMLRRYEAQKEREARFVRLVDKGLPAITNLVSGSASTFREDYGVESLEMLRAERRRNVERLQRVFPEFPEIIEVRKALSLTVERELFPELSVP